MGRELVCGFLLGAGGIFKQAAPFVTYGCFLTMFKKNLPKRCLFLSQLSWVLA